MAIDLAIRLGLIGILLYWALIILRPLSAVLIWSVVLAVALYPVFNSLAGLLGGRRKTAALVLTVLCIVMVLGPVAWALVNLIASLQGFFQRIDAGNLAFAAPDATVRHWPLIGERLYDLLDLTSKNFTAALARVAPQLRPLGSSLLTILGNASVGILTFVAAMGLAGFLLVPGPSLVNRIKLFSRRAATARGEEFVELAGSTIRRVSRGIIGISVLQASLAGLGFWMAGVPAGGLLTAGVLIFGIIQVGSAFVLIPVLIWGWFKMETQTAMLFTIYMIPVGLIDNILKPIVMGRGTGTPTAVVFLGLIGGVIAHGVVGIFIGPIVLAVAWSLLVAWAREPQPEETTLAADVVPEVRRAG